MPSKSMGRGYLGAVRYWATAVKNASQTTASHLEAAMVEQRGWAAGNWCDLYLTHPFALIAASTLVFSFTADAAKSADGYHGVLSAGDWRRGELAASAPHTLLFTVKIVKNEAGVCQPKMVDVLGKPVEIPNTGLVRVAHRLRMSDAELDAWRKRMSSSTASSSSVLKPPFEQLHRAVFPLSAAPDGGEGDGDVDVAWRGLLHATCAGVLRQAKREHGASLFLEKVGQMLKARKSAAGAPQEPKVSGHALIDAGFVLVPDWEKTSCLPWSYKFVRRLGVYVVVVHLQQVSATNLTAEVQVENVLLCAPKEEGDRARWSGPVLPSVYRVDAVEGEEEEEKKELEGLGDIEEKRVRGSAPPDWRKFPILYSEMRTVFEAAAVPKGAKGGSGDAVGEDDEEDEEGDDDEVDEEGDDDEVDEE